MSADPYDYAALKQALGKTDAWSYVELYQQALAQPDTTQLELAEIEASIWSAVVDRGEYVQARLIPALSKGRETSHAAKHRQTLFNAGHAAGPLWERLETDMTVTTATLLLRQARTRWRAYPKDFPTLDAAVLAELSDYDARPVTRKLDGGKVLRLENAVTRAKKRAADAKPRTSSNGPSAQFYDQLRKLCLMHFVERIPDVSEMESERLYDDFVAIIKTSLDDLQGKVRRLRDRNRELQRDSHATRRRRLRDAMRVLHMELPPGDDVDMKKVRKQYHRLARNYHPDHNPQVDPAHFRAVTEAYELITSYVATQATEETAT